MTILTENSDNRGLICPLCVKREVYCDAELYRCDCCACMPELCSDVDLLKADTTFLREQVFSVN